VNDKLLCQCIPNGDSLVVGRVNTDLDAATAVIRLT